MNMKYEIRNKNKNPLKNWATNPKYDPNPIYNLAVYHVFDENCQ